MNEYAPLDTRIPMHNDAYLLAAGHFLSKWPQDWDAERLALALLADEDSEEARQEDQKMIDVWQPMTKIDLHPMDEGNGLAFVEELINNLAEDIVAFTTKHTK